MEIQAFAQTDHALGNLSTGNGTSGDEKLRNQDPENHLLAYRLPRRLTAEELRDGMLLSTGELNRQVGGLPVMPRSIWRSPFNQDDSILSRPAYQPSVKPKEETGEASTLTGCVVNPIHFLSSSTSPTPMIPAKNEFPSP